ncbi:DNA-binding protein [Bradyrhizobium sp. LVM 105]|nr:DNA-binding protein [Bradyrhizobium sp. LVM 105]
MRKRIEAGPHNGPERVTTEMAAKILGLPARTVQDMALAGEIPGAAKFGRRWTFDEQKLRNYIRRREEEQWQDANRRHLPERNGAGTYSTRSSRLRGSQSGSPSKLTIRELLRPPSRS